MGQNTSSAVMQQRAEPPDSLDYFPTQPWAVRAICQWIKDNLDADLQSQVARDPACGELHMVRALADYFGRVRASDVFDYNDAPFCAHVPGLNRHEIEDYLVTGRMDDDTDWLFTNPPFKAALDFIHIALATARRGVVMVVRSSFTEGQDRHEQLWSRTPPDYILQFSERVVMLKGRLIRTNAPDPFNLDKNGEPKKASSATSYCALIWTTDTDRFRERDTRWRSIGPCRTRLERDGDFPDYSALFTGQ